MVNKIKIIEILEQIPVSAKTRNLIFYLNEAIKEIEKNEKLKIKKNKSKFENFQNLSKKKYHDLLNEIDNLIEKEKWDKNKKQINKK